MNSPNDPNFNPNNQHSNLQVSPGEPKPEPIDTTATNSESAQNNPVVAEPEIPELLTIGGSNAIVRPVAPSAETMQKLITARNLTSQSEAEKMQQLINMPSAFQDEQITDTTITSPQQTTTVDHGALGLTEMMHLPADQCERVASTLGIEDTEVDDDPRFDLVTPLHAPMDPAEIMKAVKLNSAQLGEQTKEQQKTITNSTAFNNTTVEMSHSVVPPKQQSTIEMVLATNEPAPINEDKTPEVNSPIELTTDESQLDITLVHQDDTTITSTSAVIVNSSEVELMKQALKLGTPNESPSELSAVDPLENSVNAVIGEIATIDDVAQALDEIPILDGNNSTTQEFTDVVNSGIDDLHRDDRIAEENEIDDALSLAVESTGKLIFGENYKELFTPKDLEIELTELDPTTLVLPNMSLEDLTQYCVQSTPKVLTDSTNALYRGIKGVSERLTPEINKVAEAISDPSSYLYRMHSSRQFLNTPARGFYHDILRSAHEDHEKKTGKPLQLSRAVKIKNDDNTNQLIDDTKGDKDIVLNRLKDGSIVTGTSSFKMASLLINGIRKVNLFNSGFFVVLLAPKLDLLTKYYNSVRMNSGDYGRILGQFSFIPAGVEIRSALFDLVEKLVIDSNLVDYDKPGILRKAVSSLDYSTLIWAVSSLMYPKGVDVESVCFNNMPDGPKCRHVESLKVDINSMRFNNWSLLNQESISFTDSKTKRTIDQLVDYRSKYLDDNEKEYSITEDGKWKAYLSIPSVFDAEMAHRAYIAEMITSLQVSTEEKLDQYVRAKYLTSFIPYVQKITYSDPDLGKTIVFKDPLALTNALDNLQLKEDVNLGDVIVNFLSSKTVTHICFAHHKCPSCGQYPPEAINRLIACDPEYAFFMWATARIPQ